jgi:hypothetical protein
VFGRLLLGIVWQRGCGLKGDRRAGENVRKTCLREYEAMSVRRPAFGERRGNRMVLSMVNTV